MNTEHISKSNNVPMLVKPSFSMMFSHFSTILWKELQWLI